MLERLKEKAEDAVDRGRATARVYVPTKKKFLGGLKDYVSYDLRFSYWLVGGMVLLGVVVSFLVPHGWAIWPFICVAGFLAMVNEAAERNGQGVPPFQVYAFFAGAIGVWIVIVAIFSLFNGVVIMVGLVALAYQCARAWMQERERNRLIETRRASGECVHCGQVVTNKNGVCEHCGNEPDPVGTRLRRVANIVNANKDASKARASIKQPSNHQSASAKEQALINRAHFRQGRQRPGNRR